MEAKIFEVRDRMTFMPMLAVMLEPNNESDRYLLARAGYGRTSLRQREYVLMGKLDGAQDLKFQCDWACWDNPRTGEAHRHIAENWEQLKSGCVIDIEVILGESDRPKRSEQEEYPYNGEVS